MARKGETERLAAIEDRVRALKAKADAIKAEKLARIDSQMKALKERAEAIRAGQQAKDRKRDNRQKFLMGAMLKHYRQRDEKARAWVDRKMDEFLERDQDRALFDLPPRPGKEDGKAPSVPESTPPLPTIDSPPPTASVTEGEPLPTPEPAPPAQATHSPLPAASPTGEETPRWEPRTSNSRRFLPVDDPNV